MIPIAEKHHIFMTGLTSGIGQVVLERVLAEGHFVTGIVRQVSQKQDLGDRYPDQLQLFVADLCGPTAITTIAPQIRDQKFTHILLNAGYAEFGRLHEMSEQGIQDTMQANLISHLLLVKHLIPNCLIHNTKLCLVSSLTARIPGPNYASYGIAKAGISYLVDALALEYPKLRTLCVEIGGVDTAFHAKAKSSYDRRRFKSAAGVGKRLYHAMQSQQGFTTLYWDWACQRSLLIYFHRPIMWLGRQRYGR
jgi:uncharacterized protein